MRDEKKHESSGWVFTHLAAQRCALDNQNLNNTIRLDFTQELRGYQLKKAYAAELPAKVPDLVHHTAIDVGLSKNYSNTLPTYCSIKGFERPGTSCPTSVPARWEE